MITPTIGRVVLVHRKAFGSDQPEPALICYVWTDRMINVGGFDKNGSPFHCTSLQLLQEDDEPTSSVYACWVQVPKEAQ